MIQAIRDFVVGARNWVRGIRALPPPDRAFMIGSLVFLVVWVLLGVSVAYSRGIDVGTRAPAEALARISPEAAVSVRRACADRWDTGDCEYFLPLAGR